MKRRDLLRTLGAFGAVTGVGRLLDPVAAGGQSFPAVSGRSTTDNLASRLAASIQKHKVPGASAAVFRAGQWEVAAAGVTKIRASRQQVRPRCSRRKTSRRSRWPT